MINYQIEDSMYKKGHFGIKPIKFTNIEYKGSDGGSVLYIDYSLSKLLTQNILYIAYREPISVGEIAKLFSVHRAVIEEEIYFLKENGFMINTSADNYLTNMLLFDVSLETQEELHRLYTNAAEIVCDKYVPVIIDKIKEIINSTDYFIPNDDLNFFLWSAVSFSCSRKLIFPDQSLLEPFYVTRKDGSKNIIYATVLKDYRYSNNYELYQNYEDTEFYINSNEHYLFRVWLFNSYYDNRKKGKTSLYFAGLPDPRLSESLGFKVTYCNCCPFSRIFSFGRHL